MLSTVAAILAFIGLVMPGFVVAELSTAQRATAAPTAVALVARALFYALLIHLAASPWTAWLVRDIHGDVNWTHHLAALVPYAIVVLVVVPALLGGALNWWLRRAEAAGTLRLRHAIAGARDGRDAFDYAFGKADIRGFYVLVRLKGQDFPIGGTFGTDSWAGMAPEPHDLYLEEVRSVTPDGGLGPPLDPQHGVWIAPDAIESVFVVEPPQPVSLMRVTSAATAASEQEGRS